MADTKVREIDIQQSFRKRCYYAAPSVHVVAVPNAARRTMWEARQAKKEGMAAGFPDVMCIWPGGGICFVEFKTPKGRVSENQAEWLLRLNQYGHQSAVCRSADEAMAFLRACGAPVMERAA